MSYIDEGYIKFQCDWEKAESPHFDYSELLFWRKEMWKKQWIGFYEKYQVGFGNISEYKNNKLIISGTQTGHLEDLTAHNFTEITDYNVLKNWVKCVGSAKASSETMTHAIIYEQNTEIKAIIHIHNKKMWSELLHKVPTTKKEVPYGTPEMTEEIVRLFKETDVAETKILAMEGHDEGIISFGKTLEEAANILSKY